MIDHDLKIEISEKLNASVAEVWDALTNKEKVKEYFFGTEVVTDWKVGNAIIFKGSWEGQAYEDKGKVLEVEKHKLIRYTHLSSFSGLPDAPENYSDITYILESDNGGTVLTVLQQGFKDEKARSDSQEGWRIVINNLKKMIE